MYIVHNKIHNFVNSMYKFHKGTVETVPNIFLFLYWERVRMKQVNLVSFNLILLLR